MSRSVDLPDSVFAALEEAASAAGMTPEGWIATTLSPSASTVQAESDAPPSPTPAERFAALAGGLRSRGSDTSEHCGGMSAHAGEGRDEAAGAHRRGIQISEDVYRDLELAALALGTTPAEWIAARLPGRSPASERAEGAQPPRTLADEFAGYIGLFSSGRGDLSERVSEVFTEGMAEKRRAGRL
jgi:hypothetical protein